MKSMFKALFLASVVLTLAACSGPTANPSGGGEGAGGGGESAGGGDAAGGQCIAFCETFMDGCASKMGEMFDAGSIELEAGMEECDKVFTECNADPSPYCQQIVDGCAEEVRGTENEVAAMQACQGAYDDCMTKKCE